MSLTHERLENNLDWRHRSQYLLALKILFHSTLKDGVLKRSWCTTFHVSFYNTSLWISRALLFFYVRANCIWMARTTLYCNLVQISARKEFRNAYYRKWRNSKFIFMSNWHIIISQIIQRLILCKYGQHWYFVYIHLNLIFIINPQKVAQAQQGREWGVTTVASFLGDGRIEVQVDSGINTPTDCWSSFTWIKMENATLLLLYKNKAKIFRCCHRVEPAYLWNVPDSCFESI